MYTQCPDCSTAFRVTADVLKVAAGKVRCGGCGNAFNALEFLSESMPQQPVAKEADEALPELKPEPAQKPDGLPASISAEQSAALLKTLDELAGSDIRIEDTGVEWRVLDDDDVGEAGSEPVANEANADALPANDVRADEDVDHSSGVDELLEDSPTPVDQFLTETPPQIDSPEIFAEADDKPAATSVDELRFDDDTPLPDDFDLDDESLFDAMPVVEPEEARDEPATTGVAEPQADLDLSEPDEWTDILGEFEDLAVAVAAPLEDEIAELEEFEQPQGLDEIEATAIEPEPETSEQEIDAPLDMDSQFALQAEAMGIDLSGLQETMEAPEVQEEIDLELFLDAGDEVDRDIEELLDEDLVEEVDDEEFVEQELNEESAESDSGDEPKPEAEEVFDEPDEDAQLKLIEDDKDVEEADVVVDEPEELDEPEEDDSFDIAPLTEEEQTINMQIDQDLLALAVEDEDGFASTIVIAEKAAESKARDKKKKDKKKNKDKKKKKDKKADLDLKDTGAGFETIIMEGEHIRSGLDFDQSGMEAEAAASLAAAAAEREAAAAANSGGRNWGMIGGAVALVLLLTIQVLHQSREALATIPAFHNIAGPLYRAIGMPLSPNWDVTGWRFEATQLREASTDDSETTGGSEDVTIVSRIGNNSDEPLPYPIVGVFQTVRLNEEPVGGLALDPAEYLPDDLDPRRLVEPGNSFNAVMTIRSESAEDTSFRLRVCYRNADGSLRCKNDSFRKD